MKKKILMVFLSVIMVVTMMPLSAFADTTTSNEVETSANYQTEKETPLSLKAVDGDVVVGLQKNGAKDYVPTDFALAYAERPDAAASEWKLLSTAGVTIPSGKTFYFKNALNDGEGHYPGGSAQGLVAGWGFTMQSSAEAPAVEAGGNIMSLAYTTDFASKDEITKGHAFYDLFYKCTLLTKAPLVPATKLAQSCYVGMFYECTSLVEAPVLPATVLTSGCYQYMFKFCSSLEKAPELPAKTLAQACYFDMFEGCNSLITAPNLPAKKLEPGCYRSMFDTCLALENPPIISATTLAEECCEFMFAGCKNLVNAPELNAKKLETDCYAGMFTGCEALANAPILPAEELAEGCYWQMFENCTSITSVEAYFKYDESFDYEGALTYWLPNTTGTLYCDKSWEGHESQLQLPERWKVSFFAVPTITGFEAWGSDPVTTNVKWDATEIPSVEYFVYRGTAPTGDWGNAIAKLSHDENRFTQTVDKSNTKYYYMVRAGVKGADGKYEFGPYTKVDYAWPRVTDVQGFKSYAPNATQANIVWKPVQKPGIQYWIYRGDKPYGDWGSPITKVTDLSKGLYVDTQAKKGQKNYYLVRAVQEIDGKTYFGNYTKMDYAWPR